MALITRTIEIFSSKGLLVLVFFAVLVLLHLLFIKKTRLLINIIALYASIVVMIVAFRFEQVRALVGENAWIKVGVFVALFLFLHFILSHSNVDTISARISPSSFATSLVYRIAIIGLAVSVITRYLPPAYRAQLGPLGDVLFLNRIALLFWLILPLFLAFSYRFRTTEGGWLE